LILSNIAPSSEQTHQRRKLVTWWLVRVECPTTGFPGQHGIIRVSFVRRPVSRDRRDILSIPQKRAKISLDVPASHDVHALGLEPKIKI
jgi:hypothetical protein